MSVFERTREIGILRALGWKSWSIMLLIQTEAAVLGIVGGLAGIGVGVGVMHLMAALPQTASVVSSYVSSWHLLEALGIAVLAGLVAGAIPAWRGAHLSPVEALRHD
jgi:putative ABC transport system permease protein